MINKNLEERLKVYGADELSDVELLAIIVGKVTNDRSTLEVANELYEKYYSLTNNLRFLNEITMSQLLEINGINKKIAARIKSVVEIATRLTKPIVPSNIIIRSSKDVYELLKDELRLEKSEIIKSIILNAKNVVQKIETLSIGSVDSSVISARDVLTGPIKLNAPKFILVHNHPSGDCTPSSKDKYATQIIKKCAQTMGIELLDHIVIGDGKFESAL